MLSLWMLAGWLAAVNALAFAAMGIDKARARRGDWRLSEAYLLMLAAAGGWAGAKAGQRVFRHKTRKQPFASRLNAVLAVPVIGGIVLATPLGPALVRATGLPAALTAPRGAAPGATGPAMPTGLSPDRPLPRRFGPGAGG